METRKVWFKGRIVSSEQAMVSVLSPTAQYGLNVFEGIRCYAGKGDGKQLFAFRLEDHFGRLLDSCKLLGIHFPCEVGSLREYLIETIRANDYHQDISIRMTIFIDSEGSWSTDGPAEMFIAPIRKERTNAQFLKGLNACISAWERISDNCLPPRVKTGANYMNSRYAHMAAKRDGYDLALFLGRNGKVSEGGGACLFMYRNKCLATPPLTSSVLESITRATVLRLASDLGIATIERDIDRTELYLADEVFLCGSAAEISPVTSIDRFIIGQGQPGPMTLSLLQRYLAAASNQIAGYGEWVTPIYS